MRSAGSFLTETVVYGGRISASSSTSFIPPLAVLRVSGSSHSLGERTHFLLFRKGGFHCASCKSSRSVDAGVAQPSSALFPSRVHSSARSLFIRCSKRVQLFRERRKTVMAATPAVDPLPMTPADAEIVQDASYQLTEEIVPELVYEALTWASLNGLVVGDPNVEGSGSKPGLGVVHAPVTLMATPFPKKLFEKAVGLATFFNELTDAVSLDAEFLQQTLRRAGKTDSFTAGLLNIHATILKEGIHQDIRLGIHRSDYMLDMATGGLLQIELNTISASFPGLASLVTDMHRHTVDLLGEKAGLDLQCLPKNPVAANTAVALAQAWEEYGRSEAVILMVVQPRERNMYDQHWLSSLLWKNHRVRLIRRTLSDIHSEAHLSEDGSLFIGKQLIAVVYYRAGYGPSDYPSSKEWDVRLLLERSRAVKCPTVAYQLAGAKKIQQEIARPGILERFVPSEAAAATLRESFAGLWGLDGVGADEAIEQALSQPERFVLKPQREGGGNNIYGTDVRDKLLELQSKDGGEELAAYILMQRIFPPIQSSYLLRAGQWSYEDTLSELGIYSTYLRNGNKVVLNKQAGHLLRTKKANSDEGGVAAGFAVIDSPYLT